MSSPSPRPSLRWARVGWLWEARWAWEGDSPGPGSRSPQVVWCLFRRPRGPAPDPARGLLLSCPSQNLPEGCFCRDLLSKWHLDSGLEAWWGGTLNPDPFRSGLFPLDTQIWPEPSSAASRHPQAVGPQGCQSHGLSWALAMLCAGPEPPSGRVLITRRAWGGAQANPMWPSRARQALTQQERPVCRARVVQGSVASAWRLREPSPTAQEARRHLVPPLGPLLLPQTPAPNYNHTSHS